MKTLTFDTSSSITGWSVIEDDKLVDYGVIQPLEKMSIAQRLYSFGNEIEKVLNKTKPDDVAMEEVVQVQGVSTMRVLARFNGVALYKSYNYQKRDIDLYEPALWKSNMGLKGNACKTLIQLAVCKKFNLLSEERINMYYEMYDKVEQEQDLIKSKISNIKKDIQKLKLQMKRKTIKQEDKDIAKNHIDNYSEDLKMFEKEEKIIKKRIKKKIDQISIDIYSDSGIDDNIADAIGINVAFNAKLKNKK